MDATGSDDKTSDHKKRGPPTGISPLRAESAGDARKSALPKVEPKALFTTVANEVPTRNEQQANGFDWLSGHLP